MAATLPPFLEPCPRLPGQPSILPTHYMNALFHHKRFSSVAHALWWPSNSACDTCLLFIPGNPGLLDFYTPFLTAIHKKAQGNLCILAHAFVGHTSGLHTRNEHRSSTCLSAQVEAGIEVVDTLESSHKKIVIVGHSVGSWVTLQILKTRRNAVDSVFLLFPTIRHIARTPNGLSLSWVFKAPLPRLISWVSTAIRLLPAQVLVYLFPDWPEAQLAVLRAFLDSPRSIYACLTMASDEMTAIRDLDGELLQENRGMIHMYFTEIDKWVGDNKTAILEEFCPDTDNVRVVHGQEDIPHAFCINHGEQLAEQCYKWLVDGGLLEQGLRPSP